MKSFTLIALLMASHSLFAADMNSATRVNYKNPNDDKGLCTPANEEEWQQERGFCKAIREQMTLPGCAADAIKDICKRIANDANEQDQKKKFSLGDFQCSQNSNGTGSNTGMTEIAKSLPDCVYVLTQYFAVIAIETSEWKDEKNKDKGEDEGLLGLKKDDMKDERYSCGCNTAKQKDNIPPDRPSEGHQNLVCGMYMGIYWAQKDGKLMNRAELKKGTQAVPTVNANGQQAQDNNDGPRGLSRIFKVLQGHDGKNKELNERDERFSKKFGNFCKNYKIGSAPSTTRTMDEDIEKMHDGSAAGVR